MIQLNVDTWLKVIAIVVPLAVSIGLPMSWACLEMRDAAREQRRATLLMESHVAGSDAIHERLTTRSNDLRVQIAEVKTRVDGLERRVQ